LLSREVAVARRRPLRRRVRRVIAGKAPARRVRRVIAGKAPARRVRRVIAGRPPLGA
jgi:hypothetical protein